MIVIPVMWNCSAKPYLTCLAYIQEEFTRLVHRETVVVGHSLENDLSALKISHDLVIDTAVLYSRQDHRGGVYKMALRVLARMFLQWEIQKSKQGHDSVEDARTALELALRKIKLGKVFTYHWTTSTNTLCLYTSM